MAETKEATQGGTSAKARYETLAATPRETFLAEARDISKVTLPYLIPPAGHLPGSSLRKKHQGFTAQIVLNLAAKLLLALYPPGIPNVKLSVDPITLKRLAGEDPDSTVKIQKALKEVERTILSYTEKTGDRADLMEAFLHLIVGGNVLLYHADDGLKVYPLSTYVVHRDPMGRPVEIIVAQGFSIETLPEQLAELVPQLKGLGEGEAEAMAPQGNPEEAFTLYTRCVRKGNRWTVWDELENVRVPGSLRIYTLDNFPYSALRMVKVSGPGEDYGRAFAAGYYEDLVAVDAMSNGMKAGALASAKVLFGVEPGSQTSAKKLTDAANGAYVPAHKGDVFPITAEKFYDLKTVRDFLEDLKHQLGLAFLMSRGAIRDAERVTREEVRMVAQELEEALGGVYTLLAEELQKPYARQKIAKITRDGVIGKLPDSVTPSVAGGFDALGRGHDERRLEAFLGSIERHPRLAERVDPANLIARLANAYGIDEEGLFLDDDQVAEQQNQGLAAGMAEKAAPNIAAAVGKVVADANQQGTQE